MVMIVLAGVAVPATGKPIRIVGVVQDLVLVHVRKALGSVPAKNTTQMVLRSIGLTDWVSVVFFQDITIEAEP